MNLARFLEQASRESVPRFAATTRKAGQDIIEERQTANPDLITHHFTAMLEALGRHAPEVPRIRKRVHDDVCWDDARLPFRRLPLWLVLRVGLRRLFYLVFGDESGRAHYKFFIASVLSSLLADILRRGSFDHQKMAFLNAKLSRRLSKLEADKTTAATSLRDTNERLFDSFGPEYLRLMNAASRSVEGPYENFKASVKRFIPRLPVKMSGFTLNGQNPFILILANSCHYLDSIPTGRSFWHSQQAALTNEHNQSELHYEKSTPLTLSILTLCHSFHLQYATGQKLRAQSSRHAVHHAVRPRTGAPTKHSTSAADRG